MGLYRLTRTKQGAKKPREGDSRAPRPSRRPRNCSELDVAGRRKDGSRRERKGSLHAGETAFRRGSDAWQCVRYLKCGIGEHDEEDGGTEEGA
eukprot:1160179-Pelagomonas_calceolata.AAC.3